MSERRDVDAARGDVGRHQHAVLAALESRQRLGPLRLRSVAVNPLDLDALLARKRASSIGAVLGAREDQRVAGFRRCFSSSVSSGALRCCGTG